MNRDDLSVPVNILVEGMTDERVARRLLLHVGLAAGKTYGLSGKVDLLRRLSRYNQAAVYNRWFVIVDLDRETICTSDVVRRWLPEPNSGMRFRVSVQAVEAWLMADIEQLARFLAVSPSRLPSEPDHEHNPKEALINIARSSQKSSIRNDIVPRQGSGVSVGPRYVDRLVEFATNYWQPDEAAVRSESLRRCIGSLNTLLE